MKPLPKNYKGIVQRLSNRSMKHQLLILLQSSNQLPPMGDVTAQLYSQIDLIENKAFMEDFAAVVADLYGVSVTQVGKMIQQMFPDAEVQLNTTKQQEHAEKESESESSNEKSGKSINKTPTKMFPKPEKVKSVRKQQNKIPKQPAQTKSVTHSPQYNTAVLRAPKQQQALNPYLQLWIENQNYPMLDSVLPISQLKEIIIEELKPLQSLYKAPIIQFLQHGNQRLLMFPQFDQQFKAKIGEIKLLNARSFQQIIGFQENSYTEPIAKFYVNCNNQLRLQSKALEPNRLIFIMAGQYVHQSDEICATAYFQSDDKQIKIPQNKNNLIQLPQDFLTLGSEDEANATLQVVNYAGYPVLCVLSKKNIQENQLIIVDSQCFIATSDGLKSIKDGSVSDESNGVKQSSLMQIQGSCITQMYPDVPLVSGLFISEILKKMYIRLVTELENSGSWTYQMRNLNVDEVFQQIRLFFYYDGVNFSTFKTFFDQQQELFSSAQENMLDESTILVSYTEVTCSRQISTPLQRTQRKSDSINKGKYHLEEQCAILVALFFDLMNLDGIDHILVPKQSFQAVTPAALLGCFS